jgi:hypothetical protein
MQSPLEDGRSRLAVAKDALGELLSRIGGQENYRVGLRLFGHRVGWSIDRPVRMLTSPTYSGDIPPDLTPERDVERILPLGEANFLAAQQAFAALNRVERGWGQSPLYYALAETLREDFSAESDNADKHVIVITDGRNYQARPAGGQAGVAEIVQAARARRVPIHILALAPDANDDPAGAAQTAQLASQTGGTFQPLSSSLELQTTLASLVRQDEYQLNDAGGRIVDQGQLGVRLSDELQEAPARYTVHYQDSSEDLWLDGGEAIEFYRRPNDAQLYAFPYNHDRPSDIRLTQSGQPLDLVQRVHRPLRGEHSVEFFVSLQRNVLSSNGIVHDLWRWTPRPADVWIEITPLTSDGQLADQVYPFFDANFEPDQPVPVLKLVAVKWPAAASGAMISAWYQSRAAEPLLVVPLSSTVDAGQTPTTPIVMELSGGARIRIDARFVDAARTLYRVRVIERHPTSPAALEWLKVAPPFAGDLHASHITRQFDQRFRTAVHSFDYRIATARPLQQLQSATIAVTTRQQCLTSAARAENVQVRVLDSGDLLPLAAGTTESAPLATPSAAIAP